MNLALFIEVNPAHVKIIFLIMTPKGMQDLATYRKNLNKHFLFLFYVYTKIITPT
jgi:hypothetical protein